MNQPVDSNPWTNTAFRMLGYTISYPVEYSKVLIQIGYEPTPPRPTVTFFGKPALALPNIFQYIGHIKRTDGFLGCYRGFVPKICAHTLYTIALEKAWNSVVFEDEPDKRTDESDLPEQDRRKRYFYDLVREIIGTVAGIIVSHPFDVIGIRAMAQFVGRETKYSGVFVSLVQVYKENGISGYYAGIVPRLIGNISAIVIVMASTYALNRYIHRDREVRGYTATIMSFLCTTVTYPFQVVSHCMAVNDSGLEAGRPIHMPIYGNWLECWSHLSATNQLKRGSSFFWRYYTAPRTTDDDSRSPENKNKFKRLNSY